MYDGSRFHWNDFIVFVNLIPDGDPALVKAAVIVLNRVTNLHIDINFQFCGSLWQIDGVDRPSFHTDLCAVGVDWSGSGCL